MNKRKFICMSLFRYTLMALVAFPLPLLAFSSLSVNTFVEKYEEGSSNHIGATSEVSSTSSETEKALRIADVMPEFPEGGTSAMLKYIASEVKYPTEAQKAGENGRVFVDFIIEKDGSVSNPEVVMGVSKSLDDEAIRVISSMPKWKPGSDKGKPVRVKCTVPISFKQ